jgi:cobalt/nickel transport system permease protein
MHIPDGFLSLQVCLLTYAVAIVFWYFSFRGVRKIADDRHIPLLSLFTAMFFAAQMMNYPIIGGTTAHLLGGPVLGIVLGPYAGVVSMTVILLLQAFLFGDGGLTTLGANALNMAIIGVFVPYLVFIGLSRLFHGNRGIFASIFIGSFLGDVLAAMAAGSELGFSLPVFQYGISIAVPVMAIHHAVIGVGEGVITAVIIGVIMRSRPDLLNLPKCSPSVIGGWSYGVKGG